VQWEADGLGGLFRDCVRTCDRERKTEESVVWEGVVLGRSDKNVLRLFGFDLGAVERNASDAEAFEAGVLREEEEEEEEAEGEEGGAGARQEVGEGGEVLLSG
jgi:hypothetical protein